MSSSEEYLDSLLDSILSGGKSEEEEEKPVSSAGDGQSQTGRATDAGKAMTPDEIEEMLVSMGTLDGGEESAQEQDTEADMEAMLAFMNEHNTETADSDELTDSFGDLDDSFGDADGLAAEDATDAMDELSLDDLSLDDLDMGEGGADDFAGGADDFTIDDLSLDDLSSEELEQSDDTMDAIDAMDELSLDDLSLDDLDMGEGSADDFAGGTDDFTIDDLSLDDLSSEEPEQPDDAMDAIDAMDELSLDDLSLDDLNTDESGSDELSLDDLALDDFALEESENTQEDADGFMSEEDIDRLLSGDMSGDEGASDDFALEETEEAEGDDDLAALLEGMGHDEDLSEINDLLEESEQGVSTDDDMLAMLEGVDGDSSSFDLFESDEAAREAESIRELSPEEVAAREGGGQDNKEKKKRRKLFGRKKKDKGAEEAAETAETAGDELEALLGGEAAEETPKEEKAPGFFARLMAFLLESDEEDEDPVAAEVLADNAGETGAVTDENKELLQELSEEDKKGKKKKKKKDKKGKKGKEGEEGENAEGDEEEEEKKPKKKKKKKEKVKQEEEVDLLAPPEKKLSKKKVITVFLFCGTIAACIILLSSFLPNTLQKRDAHIAYDHGEYADVYELLYGKKLNEQDEIIFQRSNLILQMNRKLSSYDNYVNLDMRLEALNALITGVERYQQILPEAEACNVTGEVNDIYAQILERLSADFGLSEEGALEILASEDDVTYSQRLEAVINGELYGEEAVEEGMQDMLPEEEEILERIEGTDGEAE